VGYSLKKMGGWRKRFLLAVWPDAIAKRKGYQGKRGFFTFTETTNCPQ